MICSILGKNSLIDGRDRFAGNSFTWAYFGFWAHLPVGVQNVFVFNQGARGPSYLKALPVIVTASFCDTILILLAVLGVSFVVLTFAWLQAALMDLDSYSCYIWDGYSGKVNLLR